MSEFVIEGVAVALAAANIDTDQIIPARFLLKSRDAGYASLLFRDQRFSADGSLISDFPLNLNLGAPIRILIANQNFGCGSAREQAAYALRDFGIRVVVAPSFGEIFRQNCVRNGVTPAMTSEQDAAELRRACDRRERFRIDIPGRTISASSYRAAFSLSALDEARLLSGRDEIDETLELEDRISDYESRRLELVRPG